MLIQEKNKINVVRLNLKIYNLKGLKSLHPKVIISSVTSVGTKEILTKECNNWIDKVITILMKAKLQRISLSR